jgi:adenosylcobinamide-phosphate synthase
VVEAAFAGALGVTLGGRNTYGGIEEDRGELGFGDSPDPADLVRANRLALAVSAGALAVSMALAVARRR